MEIMIVSLVAGLSAATHLAFRVVAALQERK
jgi:hypothetical protein